MITPNKFTPLDKSVISKLEGVVDDLVDEMEISDLYKASESMFETVQEFILALDVLYILGRIDVNFDTRTVRHAD
jgi:hypothetical protein